MARCSVWREVAPTANNTAGGNISTAQGIDYDLLAKAMAKQPAPVIGMREFLSFQEKIATFDEQIKI